jgi:hypothetical protein
MEVIVKAGRNVTVTEGPLAGLSGRLVDSSEERALIVLLLRGREVQVEMDLDWILGAPQRKSVARLERASMEFRGSDHAQ